LATPNWYLDPLVAQQKRQVHRAWIRDAVRGRHFEVALKTDLFEEAYGEDRIFDDLFPEARLSLAIDIDERTVRAAAHRPLSFQRLVCDVRRLALRDSSLDVIVSNSTLDHFSSIQEIARSLDELARVLRPGGVLLITLDNPKNPLYHLLRSLTCGGWAPFRLGETVSLPVLQKMLIHRGFEIQSSAYLIHNPRGISTILFLTLRKFLGKFAGAPIRALLTIFAAAGRLPTRSITGCFSAVAAVKSR
jgi:SAM-dependent methyltransferase